MNDRQKHLLKIIFTKNNGKGLKFGETLRIIKKENLDGANTKTLTKDFSVLEEEHHVKKIPLGEKPSHGVLYLPAIETNIILHLESFKDTLIELFKYSSKKTSKTDYDKLIQWYFDWINLKQKEIMYVAFLQNDGMTIFQIATTIFEELITEMKNIIERKITKKNLENFQVNYSKLSPEFHWNDVERKFNFVFPDKMRDNFTLVSSDMGNIADKYTRAALDGVSWNKMVQIVTKEQPESVDFFKRIGKGYKVRVNTLYPDFQTYFTSRPSISPSVERKKFLKSLSKKDKKYLLDFEKYQKKRFSELAKTPEFTPKMYKETS